MGKCVSIHDYSLYIKVFKNTTQKHIQDKIEFHKFKSTTLQKICQRILHLGLAISEVTQLLIDGPT